MQAIVTKYLGPTNSRGSRIKATCDGGSLSVPYDYALNEYDRHKQACDALRLKLAKASESRNGRDYKKSPWLWPMVGGGLPGNGGYAFVFIEGAE